MKVHHLTCNYLENPLGVETPNPSLHWMLESSGEPVAQSAYQILVATSIARLDEGIGDLWDSGKVQSDESIFITYSGKPLLSRQRVYWKVRVWDQNGNGFDWSDISFFEMGLLHPTDWKAKWVASSSPGADVHRNVPAPMFRRRVDIHKHVVSARAYVSGLGFYELYINGKKIGNDSLTPAFTRYDKTVLYQTYDVTSEIQSGANVLGIMLGNGWYNSFPADVWNFQYAPWRDQPKFILQVHIQFSDGEEMTVLSNPEWTYSASAIVFDALRNGEFYDARREVEGWLDPDFNDDDWSHARIVRSPGGVLRSQQMTPIQVCDTIAPVSQKEVAPGVWVFDLGQDISGWARIFVSGPSGTELKLRYSEKIHDDGAIDPSNINVFVKTGEFQTDKYILKGEGVETWEPRFVYHGFRYVEVTGVSDVPNRLRLEGRNVHTAFESMGSFECSNPLVNKIQEAARRSTLTNYHGIPTDCPHREKNGWTGDAALSAEQMLLNFNPMTAYTKWLRDFQDVQRPSGQLPGIIPTGGWGYNWGSGPAWDSALIIIPWTMYQYCGDASILRTMYDNMKLYVEFLQSMADGYVVDFGLGDWCPPIGREGEHDCPTTVTDTAYFYTDASLLSQIAHILGEEDESARYRELAERVREAFRKRFVNPVTGVVTGDCQTSAACALYHSLVTGEESELVFRNLVRHIEAKDRHIDAGILGAKYVMHTLTQFGRTDLAYAIASQTTFPGWGHWISQGATTLWERWNGESSRNHHMFSDISAWFYLGLSGIRPDANEPGFKHIQFYPSPVDGLDWVKASHRSMYGNIVCDWSKEENRFRVHLEVPPNSHATLYVPQGYVGVNVQGEGSSQRGSADAGDGVPALRLDSGVHEFEFVHA